MMPALLSIGDVITVRAVCADGLIDETREPALWRVVRLDVPLLEIVLQPLNADGSVNEFLDACSDIRLSVNADTGTTMN